MTKYIAAVLLIPAALACSKKVPDRPIPEGMQEVVVRVTVEDSETRSVLDGREVLWETGDAICVWDGTQQNTLSKYGDDFSGTIAESPTELCAFYPQLGNNAPTAVVKTDDEDPTFVTFLPSFQRLRPNSVSQGALMSACRPVLSGGALWGEMKIQCSFIKFTIGDAANHPVTKVRFSNTAAYLSGRCKLEFGESAMSLTTMSENHYVECGPASGAYFANGTYYVTVLPGSLSSGMTITVTTLDGEIYEYTTAEPITLGRNRVAFMGQVDSKIAAGDGLTAKYSIMIDFVNNSGISGWCADNKSSGTLSVPVNGTSYSFPCYALYNPSRHFLGNSGYIVTPALFGKTLKQIVVTYKGDSSVGTMGMYIRKEDRSGGLSGFYYTTRNTPDLSNAEKWYTVPAIAQSLSRAMCVSHIFNLGNKQSDGEKSRAIDGSVTDNTSYSIFQTSSSISCMDQIQLIYE